MNIKEILPPLAEKYNDYQYFKEDPIIFPKHFAELYKEGQCSLKDVEIAAIISAHLAWGRRNMIVRDCSRAMDEMKWEPFNYVMKGEYKDDDTSLHRTVKWREFADICRNMKQFYSQDESIEGLTPNEIRVKIYGQKSNPESTNKKIHMLRRWMVRDDGKVDLGLWKNISKGDLIIPLDVHVFNSSKKLNITSRKSPDYKAAVEITESLKEVFPDDPTLGDFALFAYSVSTKTPLF